MVDFCDNISNSRLGLLLVDVSVTAKSFLCPHRVAEFAHGEIFFDPAKENRKLLKQWLTYRGISTRVKNVNLANLSVADMKQNGNVPSFANFVDFDPKTASEDFLINWLSWYGLSSTRPRSKKWWEKLTRKTQKLRKQLQKQTQNAPNVFRTFDDQTIQLEKIKLFMQSVSDFLDVLPRDQFLSLVRLKPSPPPRSTSTPSSSWKHILAKVLGVGFIAAPIVYNYRTKLHTFYTSSLGQKATQIKQLGTKTSSALLQVAATVMLRAGSQALSKKLGIPLLATLAPGVVEYMTTGQLNKQTLEALLGSGIGTDILHATGQEILR